MYKYDSVAHAISELREKGYVEDFNLLENCLLCNNKEYHPEDFQILEVVRFEGDSDPGDEAIVYGIESFNGIKGIMVNGYGYSSESICDAIAKKLTMHAHGNSVG
jgi:hypothetical protein